MKKLTTILLVVTLAVSLMGIPVFAGVGNTVTYNGGHIYGAEDGKPGTIQMEITNITSQANVVMDNKELLTYVDDATIADKVLHTDGDGYEYSIKSVVNELNSKGGVPVYYADNAPVVVTAKNAMIGFITNWKGADKKSIFVDKYYSFDEYLNSKAPTVYDSVPQGDFLYAPGTTSKLNKIGKYLFAVNDDGLISGSPMSVFCVVIGGSAAEPTFVSNITLNKTIVTLKKGKNCSLKATIAPSNAAVKAVKWTSSNSKVAKVDINGNVKALAKGKVKITVTTIDGSNIKMTCTVTVK